MKPLLCLSFLEMLGQRNQAQSSTVGLTDCLGLGTAQGRLFLSLVTHHKVHNTDTHSPPHSYYLSLMTFSSFMLISTKEFGKYFWLLFLSVEELSEFWHVIMDSFSKSYPEFPIQSGAMRREASESSSAACQRVARCY